MIEGFRTWFDYGAETSPAGNLIKWPTEGERTCFIDGDILPYTIAFIVKDIDVIRADIRVKSGEFNDVYDTPEFLKYADIMNNMLNRFVASSLCDAARIYMTESATNFRLNLAFTAPYKGTRKSEKPPFFYELRRYLLETQHTVMADGIEADDQLSIDAWTMARTFCHENGIEVGSPEHEAFCNYVIVSKDKDLDQIPGHHLIYKDDSYRQEFITHLGFLKPIWKADNKMKKLEGGGLMFFYAQTLMGDDVDNYPGLPRCGMNKVYEVLRDCKSEKELYMATLGLYKKKYGEAFPAVNYRSTKKYYDDYHASHGVPPADYAPHLPPIVLTAYQMFLEQARLAFMMTRKDEVWRADKGWLPGGNAEGWNEKDKQV